VETQPEEPGGRWKRKPDPREPFCGPGVQIVASTHGELYYVRIYSGIPEDPEPAVQPRRERQGTVGKDLPHHADPRERVDLAEAYPGDIVALIGLKESITGDTLCETQHPILLERIVFASSGSMSIERNRRPTGRSDRHADLLKKEDPTFTWA